MKQRANLLLVNPWIYDFAAYNYWCEPLGLLSLGAVLRKAGHHVSLLDCLNGYLVRGRPEGTGQFLKTTLPKPAVLKKVPRNYGRYGMPLPDFSQRLSGMEPPDLILVTSSMTYWYPAVLSVIERLKERWLRIPVILGGTYATLCPEHACRFSGANLVVRGEAEVVIPQMMEQILEQGKEGYRGDSQEMGPQLVGVGPTDLPDLDALPKPLHELRWSSGKPAAYIAVETSRGCPFRCTYCASGELHPGFRRRSFLAVVEEITYYYEKHGIRHFAFYDDALSYHPEQHLLPLLDEILLRGLDCSFHTPNGMHARDIDLGVARRMFAAGFQNLRLGLETSNPDRQRQTGGKITNEEFEKAVGNLKKAGFRAEQVAAYILIGLPGQTETEIEDTVRFVHGLGIQVRLSEFSPIPYTQEGEGRDRSHCRSAEEEPLLQNNSLLPAAAFPEPWRVLERIKQWTREGNRRLF